MIPFCCHTLKWKANNDWCIEAYSKFEKEKASVRIIRHEILITLTLLVPMSIFYKRIIAAKVHRYILAV